MALSITLSPGAVNLSGNLNPLILSSTDPVSIRLQHNGATVFDGESYTPDAAGRILIRLEHLIGDLIRYDLPTVEETATRAVDQFKITLDGATDIDFAVIKGGVDADSLDAAVFLRANWLTWQPQSTRTTYVQPQWLRYYCDATTSRIRVKAYFEDQTAEEVVLTQFAATLVTVNVSYPVIAGKFTRQPQYYDIWVEMLDGTRLTYVQRYIYVGESYEDDYFVFQNTLGGFDSVRMTGEKTAVSSAEAQLFRADDTDHELRIDYKEVFKKNTGWFGSEARRQWMTEIFKSAQRYVVDQGVLRRIVISDPKLESRQMQANSFDFQYALAAQKGYLNLPRTDELPEVLEVSGADDLFFLEARLLELPVADVSLDTLIPVQHPSETTWRYLTLMTILAAVAQNTEDWLDESGQLHTHANKSALDLINFDFGKNRWDTSFPIAMLNILLQAGVQGENQNIFSFLTRDGADSIEMRAFKATLTDLVFKNMLSTANFASGLTGFGARIDGSGHGEMQSLTLRQFLESPELRFNRISVNTDDLWLSQSGGLIESVDTENRIITLKLEDGEMGTVYVGDLCMGIFHSLNASDNADDDSDDSKGNIQRAGFFTAYFTPTEILDERCSQFSYDLRPVSASYPRQFNPAPAMTFNGFGSSTDPNRRSSIYLGKDYIRMLVGVDDWEFRPENIGIQFGNLSNLTVHGINMTGRSAYLNNIYMTGVINQIDPDGNPIPDQMAEWVPYTDDQQTRQKYRQGAIVALAGYLFRSKRDTTVSPVGLLTSGGSYLTSGGGYILIGTPEQFINADDWEIFFTPAKDGKPGEDGAPGATGATGATGAPGPAGIPGMMIRTTEWAEGFEYHNDENLTSGERFLDVVTVGSGANYKIYVCKVTHTSSSGIQPTNTNYWREANQMAPIYTSYIFSEFANLAFTQSQQLTIWDEDGDLIAGMTGRKAVDGQLWPIWAGSSDPSSARFRVLWDGSLWATNANISGTVNATSGKIAAFTIDGNILSGTDESSGGTLTIDTTSYISYIGPGLWAGIGDLNVLGYAMAARLEVSNPAGSQSALWVRAINGYDNTGINVNVYGGNTLFDNFGVDISVTGAKSLNTGIRLNVSGATENKAIDIVGGWIAGASFHQATISGNYTVTQDDFFIDCDNTSNMTITLPSPASSQKGKMVWVRNLGTGGGSITVSGSIVTGGVVSSVLVNVSGRTAIFHNTGTYWAANFIEF